jgi:hypothetical protein
MLQSAFLQELESARNVLIAGVGGGFDIFSGLPLYFGLQADGKQVHLANLSFSLLPPEPEARLAPAVLTVTATTPRVTDYFPEKHLCQWFRGQGQHIAIHCFERTGVQPLLEAYRALVARLGVDTIILVDGGTDSLMRGDEHGLGTPQEDIASITAVHELEVERKLLACLGFGVDHYHGVCHAHFLEAVAELTRSGGFLGTVSLLERMPEVRRYREATETVFAMMPHHVSIVSSSILSALEGMYGDHHATDRTEGSRLWINPLMPLYWCFRLGPVAERILYRTAMLETRSYMDINDTIAEFRRRVPAIRPPVAIPL